MGDLEERLARLPADKRALLAAKLGSRARAGRGRFTSVAEPGESAAVLTHRQRELWQRWSAGPPSGAYHWPLVGRVLGALDPVALESALRRIVRRHAVLRTGYRREGEDVLAVVHPAQAFPFTRIDLSTQTAEPVSTETGGPVSTETAEPVTTETGGSVEGADPSDALAAALDRVLEAVDSPIDLTSGPPGRACLIRLSETEHLLAVVVHHIATDYESTELLFEEWIEAYAGVELQPAPAPQFLPYAREQDEVLARGRLTEGLAFWEKQLQGCDLRTHLRKAETGTSERLYWRLPNDLATRIRALLADSRLTPFMVAATGVGITLAAHTELRETVLSIPAPNRQAGELEKMHGCLANPILLRVRADPGRTIGEVLDEVRRESVPAYEHQDIPYSEVVARVLGDPVRPITPSARFAFAYHCGNETITANGLELDRADILLEGARADLSLSLRYDPLGIDVVAEYDVDAFTRAGTRRVVTWLEYALHTATDSPATPVGEIIEVMRSGRLPLITEACVAPPVRARPSWTVG